MLPSICESKFCKEMNTEKPCICHAGGLWVHGRDMNRVRCLSSSANTVAIIFYCN